MAATPADALEAYLDKRFTQFEDRTCLLFCQIATGHLNRETKEHNILTMHLRDAMARIAELERLHAKNTSTLRPGPYLPERPAA